MMRRVTAPTHAALIADLRPAEGSGRAPDQRALGHDDAVAALRAHAARWTLQDAAAAWVSGLWSAPFGWRSALTGAAVGAVVPVHPAEPYSPASDVCRVCGHRDGHGLDPAGERWLRHTQGAPIDGAVAEHALALDDLAGHPRPEPTEHDVWALRALLTTLRTLPPRTRPSKARDALKRDRPGPGGRRHDRSARRRLHLGPGREEPPAGSLRPGVPRHVWHVRLTLRPGGASSLLRGRVQAEGGGVYRRDVPHRIGKLGARAGRLAVHASPESRLSRTHHPTRIRASEIARARSSTAAPRSGRSAATTRGHCCPRCCRSTARATL